MKRNEHDAITLQHGNEKVMLKVIPKSGVIFMCKVDAGGFIINGSRAILETADYPELECLCQDGAWYPPLLVKALRFYDDQLEETTLPYFVHRHYAKNGRSLV